MSTRHNSRDRELEEAKQPKRNKERKKESETNKKPRRIVGFRISHSFQFPLIPLNSISLSFHNPHLPNTHTKIHRRRER